MKNNLFKIFDGNIIGSIFTTSFLHDIFVNDYFAYLSVVLEPMSSKITNMNLALIASQVGHGLASLITPFNFILITGLSYLKIPYTKWIKYILKVFILIVIILVILLIIFSKLV